MNTIWSDYIQKVQTLYLSRQLRFDDVFKEKYINAFDINDKFSILEIGCGPGALTQALHRWYPHFQIVGIDRDGAFVDFARRKAPSIKFLEEDATNLSFANNSFDVTISNTVQEHIEPSKFFGEQYRVLKPNGACLVLSARKGVNTLAPCISEMTDFEMEIYNRTAEYVEKVNNQYKVCAYPMNETELPLDMEKYGFRNISTEYITINLTPDNPVYSAEMAHTMINANRQVELDYADSLLLIAKGIVTENEITKLKEIKNKKYDKRIELYDKGIKQWDTNMSVTMILRGIK